MTDPDIDRQVGELICKCKVDLVLMQEAALWIRIGEIDRSHRIVQDDSSSVATYMHGMIHRMEGDYWNANYWFNRVREKQLLESIEESVFALREGTQGELPEGPFSPTEFTTRCEQASRRVSKSNREQLESIAFAEWQGVWNAL